MQPSPPAPVGLWGVVQRVVAPFVFGQAQGFDAQPADAGSAHFGEGDHRSKGDIIIFRRAIANNGRFWLGCRG